MSQEEYSMTKSEYPITPLLFRSLRRGWAGVARAFALPSCRRSTVRRRATGQMPPNPLEGPNAGADLRPCIGCGPAQFPRV